MQFRVLEVKLDAHGDVKTFPVDVFGDLGEWKVLSWVRNK
jgi:hypothetical protein